MRIDQGQAISGPEAERLRGQFEACAGSFERALKALKISDEPKQKSDFEALAEKFESWTKNSTFGEKQKLKNLDQVEEILDEIPEPKVPEMFAMATEAEAELARIANLLKNINGLKESLKTLETRPKIDEMERLVNVQRNIKMKENRWKIVRKNLKIGAKILSDFESVFEVLERDGRHFETVLNLGGDLPSKFLQVLHISFYFYYNPEAISVILCLVNKGN